MDEIPLFGILIKDMYPSLMGSLKNIRINYRVDVRFNLGAKQDEQVDTVMNSTLMGGSVTFRQDTEDIEFQNSNQQFAWNFQLTKKIIEKEQRSRIAQTLKSRAQALKDRKDALKKKEEKKDKKKKEITRNENDINFDDGTGEEKQKQRAAPNWETVADVLVVSIAEAERLYDEIGGDKNLVFNFNISNLIIVWGKIGDFWTFFIFAFNGVPWDGSEGIPSINILSPTAKSTFYDFKYLFWACFAMSVFYGLITIPSISKIQKGTFGINEKTGQPANFPHPQFFVSKFINVIGGSLFMPIMVTLFNAFICNFDSPRSQWTLFADANVECLGDQHASYILYGAIGLLIYYPISTLVFPNFQFQDKALDMKYNPSFIVITLQVKLILTGVQQFFQTNDTSNTTPLLIQLVTNGVLLFVLAITNFLIGQACLIRKINLWERVGYVLTGYVNLCGAFVLYTNNYVFGWIMFTIGVCIIPLITYVVFRIKYGPIFPNLKKKKEKAAEKGLIIHKTKLQYENDDLFKGAENDVAVNEAEEENINDNNSQDEVKVTVKKPKKWNF